MLNVLFYKKKMEILNYNCILRFNKKKIESVTYLKVY